MQSLQDAYSKDIWQQCIVVFTFSNYALDRSRKKNKHGKSAIEKYKAHINNYAARVRDELERLHVQNVKVMTTFESPLEPAPKSIISAIPAGDEPTDQVLPASTDTDQSAETNWTDVVFDEMVKKSKDKHKEMLLRYKYGTNRARNVAKVAAGLLGGAAGGAAVGAVGGGALGIIGGPIGIGAGAVVGSVTVSVAAGIAGAVATIEQIQKQ